MMTMMRRTKLLLGDTTTATTTTMLSPLFLLLLLLPLVLPGGNIATQTMAFSPVAARKTPSNNKDNNKDSRHNNNIHEIHSAIALLDSYETARGPYMSTLLDQLMTRTASGSSSSQHNGGSDDDGDDDGDDDLTAPPPQQRILLRICACAADAAIAEERRKMLLHDLELLGLAKTKDNGEEDNRDYSSSSSSSCSIVILDQYHPQSFLSEVLLEEEEGHSSTATTDTTTTVVLWVLGHNQHALELRYQMRTSGLDAWITQRMGVGVGTVTVTGVDANSAILYVGEGAGAICVTGGSDGDGAGTSFPTLAQAVADQKTPPEPQYRGLEFGLPLPHESENKSPGYRSILFWKNNEPGDLPRGRGQLQTQFLKRHPNIQAEIDAGDLDLTVLPTDRVWVWSQQQQSSPSPSLSSVIKSFVFCPTQRGAIEGFTTERTKTIEQGQERKEGVACVGEPSIDPSRQIQTGGGDSQWIDG